jgi:endonuclease YncB( thermonuclease family)
MEQLTYANTKSYIPPITKGKVVKVYDGDTITIATFLHDVPYRFSVRLNRIDTPEMKIAEQKNRAILARDALHDRIMNKIVTLQNVSLEKYGRILADVYEGEDCINDWMIQQNHAVVYYGGKKSIW